MGPSTGEMGTTLRFVKKSKLVNEMLLPLTPILEKTKHVGDIAVNCIVAEKDGVPDFLELTCRPGWPSWMIEQALRQGDPAKWMVDLCHGMDTLECSTDIAIGLLVAQPDFPYSRLTGKLVEGIPVFGFGDWVHHHPWEMMLKDGRWETTKDYVCVVTGTGTTVNGAMRSAEASYRKIAIPNSPFYRNDIGERLKEQLPVLQEHGYARGMTF
jgi:phosphoribosylamine--glycine ligase